MTIRLGSRSGRGAERRTDPFTDLLFNTLLGFVLLFFVAILFVNPDQDSAKIEIDAEFVITVTWPEGNPDDIDTWVKDPAGNLVWFRNKDVGLVHLDRDDRGTVDDTQRVGGETVTNPLNQEIVAIRRFLPGEYTVNLHYYESRTDRPVSAAVRVAKVRPVYKVLFYGDVLLGEKGSERTAVNFILAQDGSVVSLDQQQRRIVSF